MKENVQIEDNKFGNFAVFNNKTKICSKRSSIFEQDVVEILIENVSLNKTSSSEISCSDSGESCECIENCDCSVIVIDDTIIEDDSDNNNQVDLDSSKDCE